MWIIYSIISSFLSGIATILAKLCTKEIPSLLLIVLKSLFMFMMSLITIFIFSDVNNLLTLDLFSLIILFLSSISTLLAWLFYFKALSLNDVSKVSALDKTSIIITLLLSIIFLNEEISLNKIISILLIMSATILMVNVNVKEKSKRWILYGLLTALFTSVSSVLCKVGLNKVDPVIVNFIRIFMILIMSCIVLRLKEHKKSTISKKKYVFILLCSLATCSSWIFYFMALKIGSVVIVFTIEKLSIVFACILSYLFLKEKIKFKSILGLILMIVGVFILI